MHQLMLTFILLLTFGTTWSEEGGLDIYFVRHAETVANVTGVHSKENSRTFSAEGNRQIKHLTEQLKSMHFDAILVSPKARTFNTILPYLKETQQTAVVFPEFTECCWSRDLSKNGELVQGKPIHLDEEQQQYFVFRGDESSRHWYANGSYADGIAQVRHGVEILKNDYFGSGKSILIVAHYHSGQVLMAELLGTSRDNIPGPQNAKLVHLRQDKDGQLTLLGSK